MGGVLYSKLRSIHHFKALNKLCVLSTGASYTRENTVYIFIHIYIYIYIKVLTGNKSKNLCPGHVQHIFLYHFVFNHSISHLNFKCESIL